MSTHNLCLGARIRKIGTPLHTPALLYRSGIRGLGVYITRTCFLDAGDQFVLFILNSIFIMVFVFYCYSYVSYLLVNK